MKTDAITTKMPSSRPLRLFIFKSLFPHPYLPLNLDTLHNQLSFPLTQPFHPNSHVAPSLDPRERSTAEEDLRHKVGQLVRAEDLEREVFERGGDEKDSMKGRVRDGDGRDEVGGEETADDGWWEGERERVGGSGDGEGGREGGVRLVRDWSVVDEDYGDGPVSRHQKRRDMGRTVECERTHRPASLA